MGVGGGGGGRGGANIISQVLAMQKGEGAKCFEPTTFPSL